MASKKEDTQGSPPTAAPYHQQPGGKEELPPLAHQTLEEETGIDSNVSWDAPREQREGKESVANLLGFFLCGLINNLGYVCMLSAAVDILEDEKQGVGAVLLADILPTLLLKLTAPWYMHRLSYRLRVTAVVISSIASFHIVAWGSSLSIRLLGVVLASLSSGGGEVTFLALTSHFHTNTVSTWSSGTGGAGILGALSYLMLTVWIGLSSRAALSITSILPLIMAASYAFLLKPSSHSPVMIQEAYEMQELGVSVTLDSEDVAEAPKTEDTTFLQRLAHVKILFPTMLYLLVVYYSEYLINQGVAPAISFENSPFSERAHYVYYQALYQIGVFVSRSSVNVIRFKHSLWLLPALQMGNLVLLLAHAWYFFIPNVWVVFAVIFFEGLLGGATYVNAFTNIRTGTDPYFREFSLGVASVADTAGISLAGLTSLFLEPILQAHHSS